MTVQIATHEPGGRAVQGGVDQCRWRNARLSNVHSGLAVLRTACGVLYSQLFANWPSSTVNCLGVVPKRTPAQKPLPSRPLLTRVLAAPGPLAGAAPSAAFLIQQLTASLFFPR